MVMSLSGEIGVTSFFALSGFGGGIAYFSKIGLPHLISHGLFIHNLFPGHLISINGVLWTMGNIVQFYFVAYLLYKIVKKNPVLFWIGSVIFTIVVKGVVYAFVAPVVFPDGSQLFFLGRQLLPALDNFTTGMFTAYLVSKINGKTNSLRNGSLTILCLQFRFVLLCLDSHYYPFQERILLQKHYYGYLT